MRLTRNLADSDICHRCQTEREDMSHLLRGCPKAKNIWLKLKDLNWWQEKDRKPLPEWLKSNMKRKLKLNTDRSSKEDPCQSGYGGLLRDEVGNWLWGYHGYLGNCTSLEAEL
ncbi:hypothetical protein ACSBR2_028454 [Camellia fascicularis]